MGKSKSLEISFGEKIKRKMAKINKGLIIEVASTAPGYLNNDIWKEFKAHRKHIKKPMTKRAETLMLNKLEKLSEKGYNVNEILETAITNGWQGIVIPKEIPKKVNHNGEEVRIPSKYLGNSTILNNDYTIWKNSQPDNLQGEI